MASLNLDTIMKVGLIMAFILPALAIVSASLPPTPSVAGYNISYELNYTGKYIYTQFSYTFINTSKTLLGNCGAQVPSGIPGSNASGSGTATNCTGSFYANPTIFQAFAFILNGIGTVITDIVQLPYLDWLSLNMLTAGMATVIPGYPVLFISVGIDLLYIYMSFSLLMMGISMIQKYNMKVG
jgi:hypothetical protein